jgi:hypothetical protein
MAMYVYRNIVARSYNIYILLGCHNSLTPLRLKIALLWRSNIASKNKPYLRLYVKFRNFRPTVNKCVLSQHIFNESLQYQIS